MEKSNRFDFFYLSLGRLYDSLIFVTYLQGDYMTVDLIATRGKPRRINISSRIEGKDAASLVSKISEFKLLKA